MKENKKILYCDSSIKEKMYFSFFLFIAFIFASLGIFFCIGTYLVFGIGSPIFWFFLFASIIFITSIPFLFYFILRIRFEIHVDGVIVSKPMIKFLKLLLRDKKDGIFIPFEKITNYKVSKFNIALQIYVNEEEWGLLLTNPMKAYTILDQAYKDFQGI